MFILRERSLCPQGTTAACWYTHEFIGFGAVFLHAYTYLFDARVPRQSLRQCNELVFREEASAQVQPSEGMVLPKQLGMGHDGGRTNDAHMIRIFSLFGASERFFLPAWKDQHTSKYFFFCFCKRQPVVKRWWTLVQA